MDKLRFSMTISGTILCNKAADAPDILDSYGLRMTPGSYSHHDAVVVDNVRITCDGELQEELKLEAS